MSNTSPSAENMGFLTVIDQPRIGLTGGYLVLNQAGRPLEFHCTIPLKPNRTQEILYGDTLESFFCGELIAKTLLSKSQFPASYVLTNVAAVLGVQELVQTPVFYVFDSSKNLFKPDQDDNQLVESSAKPLTGGAAEAPIADLFPAPKTALQISEELNASLKSFGIENSHLCTKQDDEKEKLRVPTVPGLDTDRWKETKIGNRLIAVPMEDEHHQLIADIKRISRLIDLVEPFTRLRLAIEETQRAA